MFYIRRLNESRVRISFFWQSGAFLGQFLSHYVYDRWFLNKSCITASVPKKHPLATTSTVEPAMANQHIMFPIIWRKHVPYHVVLRLCP